MSDRQQRFAETIKARRLELGITQDDVADACGVRQPAVSAWESATKYPTVDKLELLAKVLKLDVGDLLDPGPAGSGSDDGSSELSDAAHAGRAELPDHARHTAIPRGASPAPLSSASASNDTGEITDGMFDRPAVADA